MLNETPHIKQRVDQVPLDRAVLCTNCETISVTCNYCPACGSVAVLNLAQILNRERVGDQQKGEHTNG